LISIKAYDIITLPELTEQEEVETRTTERKREIVLQLLRSQKIRRLPEYTLR